MRCVDQDTYCTNTDIFAFPAFADTATKHGRHAAIGDWRLRHSCLLHWRERPSPQSSISDCLARRALAVCQQGGSRSLHRKSGEIRGPIRRALRDGRRIRKWPQGHGRSRSLHDRERQTVRKSYEILDDRMAQERERKYKPYADKNWVTVKDRLSQQNKRLAKAAYASDRNLDNRSRHGPRSAMT